MLGDDDPFWFASTELLTHVARAEISAIAGLFAKYGDIRELFDAPEATLAQRTVCFQLLARRKIMEIIFDKFADRYEDPFSLIDVESDTIRRTYDLVSDDAPAWVLEMHQVVQKLPVYIYASLPGPLQKGNLNSEEVEQIQAFQSAKQTLSNVEQVQAFTNAVLDQQLQRLARRWSAANTEVQQLRQSPKRRVRRTRDKQRMLRDREIAETDDVADTIHEFLQLMDERNVKPQPTWSGWPGSWVQAYKIPRLRKLIHQDKSRAIARARIRTK